MKSKLAKEYLRTCQYDPQAERSYDVMRGGFYWSDELPPAKVMNSGCGAFFLREVVVFRASLTRREPNAKYAPVWRMLKEVVPTWPGFRAERIYGQIERDLKAADLRLERCLPVFEDSLEEKESDGHGGNIARGTTD